jgi:hypothetical protein
MDRVFERALAEGAVLEPLTCWLFVAAASSQIGGVFTRELSEDTPPPGLVESTGYSWSTGKIFDNKDVKGKILSRLRL